MASFGRKALQEARSQGGSSAGAEQPRPQAEPRADSTRRAVSYKDLLFHCGYIDFPNGHVGRKPPASCDETLMTEAEKQWQWGEGKWAKWWMELGGFEASSRAACRLPKIRAMAATAWPIDISFLDALGFPACADPTVLLSTFSAHNIAERCNFNDFLGCLVCECVRESLLPLPLLRLGRLVPLWLVQLAGLWCLV